MANKRILVLAEPHIQKLVKVNLERAGYPSYQVEPVENEAVLIGQIEEQDPDLVILDFRMNGGEDWEVIGQVVAAASAKRERSAPVLILSAFGDETVDTIKGWSLGISGWVKQPFSPAELADAVHKIFDN